MSYASLAALILGATTILASCGNDAASGDGQSSSGGAGPCGALCDPAATCPVSCDDGNACTADQMTGNAQTCDAACVHTPVTACVTGDGCCPVGCSGSVDRDCFGGASGAGGGIGAGGAGGVGAGGVGVGGVGGVGAGGIGVGGIGAGGTDGSGGYAPNCDQSAIGESPSTLSVDVTAAQEIVHKEIFGVLLEILGRNINGGIYVGTDSPIPNTSGIRNDIIEGFKEAGVGAVQWPGGCAANGYNWQSNLRPNGTMGTDLFMEFSKWIGAEPFLVGRPQPQYAQSNRDWVEYVNDNPDHPDWNLKYFKVGNEVWGCGGDLGENVATYETWYNAHYDVLNAPVNGKDLFLVGATGGIWTVNPNTNNWLTTMLSPGHIADRVDGIEIHDYLYFPDSIPAVGFSDNQYYDIVHRANEGQIAPRIRDIKTILDRNDPDGRIKIIEDEWGDWLDGDDPSDGWFQKNTLMDGISAAEHLHVFMEHADRIQMAGLAQSTNVIHSLFATNSNRGGTELVKTPTFYVFKMFVPHHTTGAKWAPSELSSETINGNGRTIPVVTSGVTVNDDGRVHVSLVNVDLVDTHDVTITLDSAATGYIVESAQLITGQAKDSYNDFGQAEAVNIQALSEASYEVCAKKLKVTLPSKSVVMLALKSP